MYNLKLYLVFITLFTSGVQCWDTAELEMFDLVEEVKENFYDILGVSKDASTSDIKKAYRTLSKQIHPDKSDAPDAEVKFRQLVGVYEVLKDEKLRASYERVLVDGLPDWRSPIFYYRRARKMSLLEISVILTIVISITQYLMAWGSYFDRRQTMEEYLLRKYKIKDKRKLKPEEVENRSLMEQELTKLVKPSCWNILPVQLVKFSIFLVKDAPGLVMSSINAMREEKKRQLEEKRWREEEEKRLVEEEERRKENRAIQRSRKRASKLPDYSGDGCILDPVDMPDKKSSKIYSDAEPQQQVITGGPWTEEDFAELARLMAKYPGGTPERWERIAEQIGRTVFEVTTMSSRVKSTLATKHSTEEAEPVVEKVKIKSRPKAEQSLPDPTVRLDGPEVLSEATPPAPECPVEEPEEVVEVVPECALDCNWTSLQQKVLETSLKSFPKGTEQRWDMIARCVPGKTKEECMLRYKYLAERIKRKKESA